MGIGNPSRLEVNFHGKSYQKEKNILIKTLIAEFNREDLIIEALDLSYDRDVLGAKEEGQDAYNEALVRLLRGNTTLTTLNIRSNQIGPEGAQALAGALKENKTLTTLSLGGNQIGDEGEKALV
jgi:hypothetical protein